MMGSLSIWHWLILAVIVALLFGGKGKLSGIMGDAAKGIRAFKDGLKTEDDPVVTPAQPTVASPPLSSDARARQERDATVPRAEL